MSAKISEMVGKKLAIISASYGNDSIALIELLRRFQYHGQTEFEKIYVAYCDTGWASALWGDRVDKAERWVEEIGWTPVRVHSLGMKELVKIKKSFPSNQYQFCTAHLKGVPFLQWADAEDAEGVGVVLVGKRRAESRARANTPEFVHGSEFHGGRLLWHPLYWMADFDRNELLKDTPFPPLPHRSQECCPCVNANRKDFELLTKEDVERVSEMEVELGKPMFRPKRFGALGIYGVMAWAKHGRRSGTSFEVEEGGGCDGHYGCEAR